MTRTEQIRKEILLQLYACRPLAVTPERMSRDSRKQGYDFTQAELARETQFLVDESLAIECLFKGTTDRFYRISNDGIRQFEQLYCA